MPPEATPGRSRAGTLTLALGAALALSACAGPATVTWLAPLQGEATPPLRAYLTLASEGEAERLLGPEATRAGLLAAWLVLENRDPAPVGLALPLQLGLRDWRGEELAQAVALEEAVDALARSGATHEPATVLRELAARAAPLAAPVPGGEQRRGLVLFALVSGRELPAQLAGLTLWLRVAPSGQRVEPLVGGELLAR